MNKFQQFTKIANEAKQMSYDLFWNNSKEDIFNNIKEKMISGLSSFSISEKMFNNDKKLMEYVSGQLKNEGFISKVNLIDGDYNSPSTYWLEIDLINEYKPK